MPDPHHVVVVGAGFGGLNATRELVRAARRRPLRVTLIDARNHHTFQPLLYQVATSGLQPQDVGQPIRAVAGLRRAASKGWLTVRLGTVAQVDASARAVVLADGERLNYDSLVLSAGAVTEDFGVPGVHEHAFGLKSIGEAIALRNHVLTRIEQAEVDGAVRGKALTVVIAGGGPTGVELAGAFAELVRHPIRRDHPTLDLSAVRIVLVELQDRVLGAFSKRSSRYATGRLEALGVEVRLGTAIKRVEHEQVVLADGEVIPAGTIVWAAGVRAAPLADQLGWKAGPGGRISVGADLRVPEVADVFAIGDLAAVEGADGRVLPQLAPVAIQAGRHAARQVVRRLEGAGTEPFVYRDKGIMATVGRNAAVAELPFGIRFRSFPAWVAWLGLHLWFLVGFRNRVAVLLTWIWSYLTYDRAARIVVRSSDPPGLD